jgi:hypothetical protein
MSVGGKLFSALLQWKAIETLGVLEPMRKKKSGLLFYLISNLIKIKLKKAFVKVNLFFLFFFYFSLLFSFFF